jgi:hypothetical protein
MRWLLVLCLILCGCAGLDRHSNRLPQHDPSLAKATEQAELESLLLAIQSLSREENQQLLEGFIERHPSDRWGRLASQYRELYTRLLQQRQQNQTLVDQAALTSKQTQQLNQKLQKLQLQLDELTRSLIKQETRQP